MPSKTYAQLTLQTSIQAPGDLAAAYPTGGPLYALTWRNVFLSIDRVAAAGLATPLITTASVTGAAGFNVPAGVAPTTPNNGDIWTTASGFFVRYGGATQQMLPLSGGTLTGELITVASGSVAGFNLPHGSAPASPVNGDTWTTTAGYFCRINGSTVQLSTGSVVPFDANPMLFGDGSDGNTTISGSTTLSRDMYYNNLTIGAAGALNTAGYKVFVAGILDITAAPAGGIQNNGAVGGNASGATGGSAGAATSLATTSGLGGLGTSAGKAGISGGTGVGGAGQAFGAVSANGGIGGNAGAGGLGSGGAGGAAATSGAVTTKGVTLTSGLIWPVISINAAGAPTYFSAAPAQGGAAGGAGGGDGANSGGGSGAGGSPGGVLAIFAATINRGAGTAASAIQALGGAAGTSAGGVAGNSGGAGGSGGGGGGWITIICRTLSGATATNCLDTTAGSGSAGGAGVGTGIGGDGGASGAAGAMHVAVLGNSTFTRTAGAASVAGGAHSGVTGGTGGTATTNRVNL